MRLKIILILSLFAAGCVSKKEYLKFHADQLKFDEIMTAFPDEIPEPRRMAFEDFRRQQKAEARKKGDVALGRA